MIRARFAIITILSAAVFHATIGCYTGVAQIISPFVDSQFELAESVEADKADSAVLAQLERAKTFLADKKWDDAVETLCRVMDNSEGKLLAATDRRFVGLRDYCQMQLASLPADALKLYRDRVDAEAKKWYEQGLADHDPRLLKNVVDQTFTSSWGDNALLALGDIALEAGHYAKARWYWERIIPQPQPLGQSPTWPGYPDTDLDLAAVRARLVLVSILDGSTAKAGEELDLFTRLHGELRGRLGGREVKYAEELAGLLSESTAWPLPAQKLDWPTFAGSTERNTISPRKFDSGAVAWRVPLPQVDIPVHERNVASAPATTAPLSYHPAIVGDLALVGTDREVLAVRLNTGKPAWGHVSPTIFRERLDGPASNLMLPSNTYGTPRYTLTVFGNKLYAYIGSGITSVPQGQPMAIQPGCLICLDLSAEGRLLWKITPDEGWAFDGTPVADDSGVYVAMRRFDIRPQAYVACFDAQSGRLRWRLFVASAETPARGMMFQVTHNLLTLAGDSIYFNTNLGAVAAIGIDDGRLQWLSLYPRQRKGDMNRLESHWQRDLNPCIYHRGVVYVVPADSPRIFAFDAYTGQILWQSGTQTEFALDLLAVTDDFLIAGGKKLYWIGLKDEDRGVIKHLWPEGNEKPGIGRGVVADDCVLWPTRDQIMVFDLKTARPRKSIDLLTRGAEGGNLLVIDRGLLMATGTELIALQGSSNPPRKKQEEMAIAK